MQVKKFGTIAGVLFLLGAAAALWMLLPPSASREPVPNPNGYDDFRRASSMLGGLPENLGSLPVDSLRPLLATNRAALQAVREGIQHGCRIPPGVIRDPNQVQPTALANSKELARLLDAEANLALVEQHTNQAALVRGDLIRFGTEFCRGGPLISHLVGIAVESLGVNPLLPLVPSLDAPTCRELLRQLQTVEQRRESISGILANEAEWVHYHAPLTSRVVFKLLPDSMNPASRSRGSLIAKIQQQQTLTRQLQLDLAAQCYRIERGREPAAAADLVPDFLPSVPIHAATGAALPLRVTAH